MMYIICILFYLVKLNNKLYMKNMNINYVCLYCDDCKFLLIKLQTIIQLILMIKNNAL